jgi:hypothetical protein
MGDLDLDLEHFRRDIEKMTTAEGHTSGASDRLPDGLAHQ